LKVTWGSARRSKTSAAEIAAAPTRPAHGPPETAQARTGAAAHDMGSVDTPWLIRVAVSTHRVAMISAAATPTSAAMSQGRRPTGRA
jgi:hypothetical protein